MITRTLATELPAEPPTEFRIFAPGINQSLKGPTLFDAKAAQDVMAAYRKHGCDLMIDLEHESLADRPLRPDSKDARGWFQLDLRPDGSLWAVNVRWTPDGERRLRERTQRYISPAFLPTEDDRPSWLVNVALCAMPATDHIAPLVAASATARAATAASAEFKKLFLELLARTPQLRQTSVSPKSLYRSTRISNGSGTHQKGARSSRIR